MPRAICEDCGSLVEAELTHNGICAVGHYVHCGWGHQLSPDDLISDDAAEIISKLETKLAKAVEALEVIRDRQYYRMGPGITAQVIARRTLAQIQSG